MFEIITIPFDPARKIFDTRVLNQFTLNKRIKSYKAEFFASGDEGFWTVFLEFDPLLEKNPRGNREAVALNDAQKALYEQLRAWRKEKAEKEGIPAYLVATNKDLVSMTQTAPRTFEAMKTIKGFGKGKIDKYGKEMIEIISAFYKKDE